MKKLILSILALTLILIFACKKDEELTKTDLLCSQPWILTSSTFSPPYPIEDFGAIADYYAILAPCRKDDIWSFKKNGDYTLEDGVSKCDPLDPTVLDFGTWIFNSDETVLTTNNGIYFTEYSILELTKQTLQVRTMIVDTLQNVYNWTESYAHQ
jgi:hypothetical protein